MYTQWAEETMEKILAKLEKTAPAIGARFPHATKGGEFDNRIPSWWTNGFWPGILWMAYQETGKEEYKKIAESVEEQMDVVLDEYDLVDHDAGFIWLLSAGANYKLTKNEKSRIRLMKAACFLMSRFNLKGRFIRAWNGDDRLTQGLAIIDCSMNLPLLYWASNTDGDGRFRYIAEAHAETVVKRFIREDGSVNHMVVFDPETGEFEKVLGGQGAAPDSAWSRGASWALYGMALAYRHLKDEKYLQACRKVADFFIESLPEDYVAHWDFRVERTSETPRDTSAAACAACGLLELAESLGGEDGAYYKEKAYLILKSLTENYSNFDNDKDQAILFGGTGNKPREVDVNVGLIYGDYYYMEGVSRLKGKKDIYWYSV